MRSMTLLRCATACTARFALAIVGAGVMARPVAAQGDALPDRGDVTPVRGPVQCSGETIRDIVILSSAPTVAGAERIPVLGQLARATHVTTQPAIVRGFLLFAEGDSCTELARAESERVLRAQPFIADATVDVEPVDGGVRMTVRTIDEGAIVFGTRILSGDPLVRSLRLGSANLSGRGVYLAGEWRAGGAMRDGAGLTFADHQVFGKPYVLYLHARRAPYGGEWRTSLTRPFLTGLQRLAWRAGAGSLDGYTELVHPDSAAHAILFERRYADVGAMGRIGTPIRMGLLGLVVSHELERAAQGLTAFAPDGRPVATDGVPRAPTYESTRLNAFVGFRALEFAPVAGFDALSATQDIPTGVQLGLVAGRGLDRPVAGAGHELFLAADVYAGRGSERSASRLQLRGQGTRTTVGGEWARVIATGRVSHQFKPSAARTVELAGDWALAWHPGLPTQLLLGERDGGVRGYRHSRAGGGRRASARLEERRRLVQFGTTSEIGTATFLEAGRVWRGDTPFGVTTPVRTALGVSLLAAVPARSARLWRVDLAFPLQGTGGRRFELGFSNGDRTATFWREPDDIESLRGRTVPASVFAWP